MRKLPTKRIVVGLLAILGFTTGLLFLMGPELIRIPALLASFAFWVASWVLSRGKRKGESTNPDEAGGILELEGKWIREAIAKKFQGTEVELEVDPISQDAEAKKRGLIYLQVKVDGRALEKKLVLPLRLDLLSGGSDESRRFLLRDQIETLS